MTISNNIATILEFQNSKGRIFLCKEKFKTFFDRSTVLKYSVKIENNKGLTSTLKESTSLKVASKFFNEVVQSLRHETLSLDK